MEIRVELKIDLNESEQFLQQDYRAGGADFLVTHLCIQNQLPTSETAYCHGNFLRKDGTPGTRRGLALVPVEKLPEPILNELKRRGAIQSRIGTVKRHRGSEAARQAALG